MLSVVTMTLCMGTPHGCVIATTKARLIMIQLSKQKCVGVVKCSCLISRPIARAAPHARSNSESVQTLSEEKVFVDKWMPVSSLGGLSSPEEER